MPRFAPEGAKKERAERLAREAKEAKMASQQARRHQTAGSYQDELQGTNTYIDSHDFVMSFGTCFVCFNTCLCVLIFRCHHSHDFCYVF
jgi:hypothetical protein